MLTRIGIENLRVECLIGVRDPERKTPQSLRVDLEVWVNGDPAASSDDLQHTYCYDMVARDTEFLLQAGRFYLLETASWVLLRMLLLPQPGDSPVPSPTRATVTLTKYGALAGQARAVVNQTGLAAAQTYVREDNDWGTVDVIAETRRVGIYRLNLAPGQSIPRHVHHRMREAELVLDPGLVGWQEGLDPRVLEEGERFSWERGQAHGYRNSGDRVASILCVDAPPFIPEDEVPLGGEP
jgi:dihydroneopterin aldolase